MDGFTDLKLAMIDGLTMMRNCLLNVPWAAADGALSRIITN
jgi:hypothetical protein